MAAEFITAAEAAKRWDVSLRQVQRLLHGQRIPGAVKYGAAWMIPANSDRPPDQRHREAAAAAAEMMPFNSLPRMCPALAMTSLYCKPGSGDETARSLADDPEAERLFRTQLAYFRGEIDMAAELAGPLLESSARRDIRLGAGFALCLCAMYTGDVAAWLQARRAIANVPCDAPEQEAQRELLLVGLDSGIFNKHTCPDWLRRGCFDLLPGDSYPLAR